MSWLDWLLIALVAAGVFFAARYIKRRGTGCCGDCAKCAQCARCDRGRKDQ